MLSNNDSIQTGGGSVVVSDNDITPIDGKDGIKLVSE